MSEVGSLADVLAERRVVVCCGTGGVGKTTTAAALALAAARAGRRTALVTIDPARRLADALGLGELGNDAQPVTGVEGELWACMLDARRTFDDTVRRYASSPAQAERILSNRFYRNVAGSMGGTQEYMATERLYELTTDGRFDLVVVDTPPTRNALDMLTAPRRLTRLLDNRIFRLLMAPGKIKVVNAATQTLLRSVGKVVGGDVIADAIEFFHAFEGMEAGFRARSQQVLELLHAEATAWVLVTSPRPEAMAEAKYFSERLAESGVPIAALIANRVTPRFEPIPPLPPIPVAGSAEDGEGPATALVRFIENARALNARADQEAEALRILGAGSDGGSGSAIVSVPDRGTDLHDLDGISWMADRLVTAPNVVGRGARPDRKRRTVGA